MEEYRVLYITVAPQLHHPAKYLPIDCYPTIEPSPSRFIQYTGWIRYLRSCETPWINQSEIRTDNSKKSNVFLEARNTKNKVISFPEANLSDASVPQRPVSLSQAGVSPF